MCGILGELRFSPSTANRKLFNEMLTTMVPRGPDSEGEYYDQHVSLGHRRLSIIDLSPRSAQPMHDPDLGLRIVYNGEIYNYRELKQELLKLNYQFRTESDTEVLMKSFHAWGKDCLLKFRGMFAFAIWDEQKGRLFMARDPMGIKPLYYTENSDRLLFASSLPALLKDRSVNRNIDPISLNYYMSFHSVVPEPRTILEGIKKLPAGSYMEISTSGQRMAKKYWHVDFNKKLDLPFEEQKALVKDSLRKAVERRLVADVPVGVFLSGGLDSSLIVGLLAEAMDLSSLHTFSVGFENVQEEGNEFQYSDIVAKRFGTQHHKIFVGSDEMLQNLPSCIRAMSEPMVSHDNIGFYILSRETAKELKVVQSGQGADEVFGGYHWYPKVMGAEQAFPAYREAFFDRNYSEYAEVVAAKYRIQDYASDYVEQHFHRPGTATALDHALRIDTEVMLTEDPVKRVDNMTMAFSLEARVPFLDIDLVTLAAQLPDESKVAPDGGKHILKEIAREVIPHEVIDRPKGYFPVPGLKYIQGDYLTYVQDILSQPAAVKRGIFEKPYVDMLLKDPTAHMTPLRCSKLWQIALLETWLQTHEIG
ncbi:MAG: N-acetylglutaminylglutamine amidotransferase [Oligoflexus sp.]